MLESVVSLHDIDDVEGFVCATIEKFRNGGRVERGTSITEAEREELIAEGICILYELAEKFEPHRPGYEEPGRFSGFAAQFLPRRLGDAWHQKHRHRRVAGEDGKRRWVYTEAPLSLDNLLAESTGSTSNAVAGGKAIDERTFRPHEQWAAVAAQ